MNHRNRIALGGALVGAAVLGLIAAPNIVVAEPQAAVTSSGQQVTCVTDAQSGCTIRHDLGVKPVVTATVGGRGQLVSVPPDGITTTSYRLNFNWRTGATFAAGTRFTVQVHLDVPDAPPVSTPPTSETPTVSTPPVSTPPVSTPPTTETPSTTPPTTATPTPTPGACDTAKPAYQTSTSNGSWMIDGSTQVNNNMWSGDAGPQTLYACAWNKWSIISNQPGAGHDDGVKTYPDTQKHVTLPLANMTTLNSTFKVNTPSAGGVVPTNGKQWNAAYDLWLGNTSSSNWDTEVMVWNNWTANWQYWYGQLKGEMVTFDGVTYAAYHRAGSSGQAAGIWFIRQTVTNDGSVDLAPLLKWAVSKGWMPSASALREIEYGFEVLYTGEPTRFDLLDFTIGN